MLILAIADFYESYTNKRKHDKIQLIEMAENIKKCLRQAKSTQKDISYQMLTNRHGK